MPHTEGLGKTGIGALLLLLIGILAVVVFGFGAAIVLGILLTVAAMGIIITLCLGDTLSG